MTDQDHDYDWVIVGSGFGGSVSALRLAEKGYRVLVLEEGRRFADEDFARSAWELSRLLWAPRLGLRGILRVRAFRHVTVLAGAGVGGGSLVYGGTLYRARSDAFFRHPQWSRCADWRHELAPHYGEAERMLGVTAYSGEGPSERLMQTLAGRLGVPDSYHPTSVGVFLGPAGETMPDPYFDGAGPDRVGCLRCGQCMLGCRHGAKNTLVKNYLHLAEAHGAVVASERRVVGIEPGEAADGSDGYLVHVRRPRHAGSARPIRTAGVIVAAGPLGTNELLRRCVDGGLLPRLSRQLGELVRTNSESITAITAPAGDLRAELAITASIHPDSETHITNNTLGLGGDALALSFVPLRPRSVRGWSKRSVVLTTMRTHEETLSLRPAGRRRRLQTVAPDGHGPRAGMEVAAEATRIGAATVGGVAQRSLTEMLTRRPTTAHLLGGAAIGESPETGVVDHRHRVFGYRNLLVCDGAAVPANLGVNPSLTIAALTERAMAFIPVKSAA